MGLFNLLKRKTQNTPLSNTAIQLVTEQGNGFYSWNGELYQSDIIRSVIRPKAKAIGKLLAKHIRDNGQEFKINPEPYIKFLLEEPNPFMTGQILQEKLTVQLELNGNAFALIIDDEFGYPSEIYPIPSMGVEAKYIKNILHLKFTFKNGQILTVPYSKIIHLRKDFNDNDIFGESPASALTSIMEIVNTTDQGVIKAVRSSAVIKWLLKFKQVLKDEDINKQVNKFVANYLNIDSENGGAAAIDPRYDAEQVKPENYVPNASQMDKTMQRLYNFFNTNEKIVQSRYTEDEWNSYYESEIEPVALQLSGQYTTKLFSRKERGFGNEILFESSNLHYASMSTKMNLVQMVDRGAMTPNEWRNVLSLGPIENGDKPIRRLDTAVVEGGENNAKE